MFGTKLNIITIIQILKIKSIAIMYFLKCPYFLRVYIPIVTFKIKGDGKGWRRIKRLKNNNQKVK